VHRLLILIAIWIGLSDSALGVDRIVARRDGTEVYVEGRVLTTAADGGLLLVSRDGVLWTVEPADLVKHTTDSTPFEPFSRDEMTEKLLGELPDGFDVHPTANYLIFYNTSRSYAGWCGSLFERLHMAFTNFWSRRGFDLVEPEFPLAAILFADKQSYIEYSRAKLGDAAGAIVGYFDMQSNRMVMYDLTGLEASGMPQGRVGTYQQINRILSQPGAAATVATVVHEATHQIAFNCGLHTRYSDCPLWFSEGIALYFETPDLRSTTGWRNVGAVNLPRLSRFRGYMAARFPDSLETLVADDTRFTNLEHSLDAYAEAWALTYFLLTKHPKEYIAYLKLLSKKEVLIWDDKQARLADFKKAFGDDPERLNAEFVRYMMRLR